MAIKVKYKGSYYLNPIKKGDWIDLHCVEDVALLAPKPNEEGEIEFDNKKISLGIAMDIPEGFHAQIIPRSSTFKKFGIILSHHFGVIDNSYRGNDDIWHFDAIAFRDTIIHKRDRICQFQICLSQQATFFQKLKWLFSSTIEFEKVERLDGENRGGFGTTGIN